MNGALSERIAERLHKIGCLMDSRGEANACPLTGMIDDDAKTLSARYGVPLDGVRTALAKVAVTSSPALEDGSDETRRPNVKYEISLAEAFEAIPTAPGVVLALVGSQDVSLLKERIRALYVLVAPQHPPMLALAELAETTARFAQHLNTYRESILRDGAPAEPFPGFVWFDQYATAYRVYDEEDLRQLLAKHEQTGHGEQLVREFRERFLDAKIEILRRLRMAVGRRDANVYREPDAIASGMRKSCMQVLGSALPSTEVLDALSNELFELRILGGLEGVGPPVHPKDRARAGSIILLLELVGQYEWEIRSLSLHTARSALDEGWSILESKRWDRGPGNYIRIVNELGADRVNSALDLRISQEKERAVFWQGFADRCDEFLISDIPEAINQASQFRKTVRQYFESVGQISPESRRDDQHGRFVFKREAGGSWLIVYDGCEFKPPSDWLGMRYIHRLLQTPGEDLFVTQLMSECGRLAEPDGGQVSAFRGDEGPMDGRGSVGVAGRGNFRALLHKMTDAERQAYDAYSSEIAKLEKTARQLAPEINDPFSGEEAREALEELLPQLQEFRKARNDLLRGHASDATKKHADSVRLAIKRAVEKLEGFSALYAHLIAPETFSTGFTVRYCPTHIPWETE